METFQNMNLTGSLQKHSLRVLVSQSKQPEKPRASVAYSWWLLELIQEAGLSCRPFREHTTQWSL